LVKFLKDKEYCINVISKSGTTTEPAIAFRILQRELEEKYGEGVQINPMTGEIKA
jgi:glucose-6-phosphate isomerase